MPPVAVTFLAFVVALFQSRASLHLENLALRHQVMVYQQTVHRLRLHPTDHLFWAWLSRVWPDWREALETISISDEPCSSPHPNQCASQLEQT